MAKKKHSLKLEITTLTAIVLMVGYFAWYYFIKQDVPECNVTLYVTIPLTVTLFSGLIGSASSIINKLKLS